MNKLWRITAVLCCLIFTASLLPAVALADPEQKPSGIVEGLGIMSASADGGYTQEDTVSRAMFAQILVRMYGMGDSFYGGTLPYSDVKPTDWFYDSVGIVTELGYMRGTGGLFRPDEPVDATTVVKAMLDLAGYRDYADTIGTQDRNYFSVAAQKGFTAGVSLEPGGTVTRGQMAKLAENTLFIDVLKLVSVGEKNTYEVMKKQNVLYDRMKIVERSGVITGFGNMLLDEGGEKPGAGQVMIDDTVYDDDSGINFQDLFGMKGKYYLKEEDDTLTLVYADFSRGKNEVRTIREKDIDSAAGTSITYLDEETAKTERLTLASDVRVLYNARPLSGFTGNDLIPEYGEIRAVDNNNDGRYDVVMVWDYQTYVIERFDYINGQIWDKYGNGALTIGEKKKPEYAFYDAKGNEAGNPLFNCVAGNVLEAAVSRDGNYLTVIASDQSVKGTITELSADKEISLDGVSYPLSELFLSYGTELEPGMTIECYLNSYGEVAGCDIDYSGGYSYGYLIGAEKGKGLSDTLNLKIFTQQGAVEILETKNKILFNNMEPQLNAEAVLRALNGGEPQLIQYKQNQDAKVTMLKTALDNTAGEERFDKENFSLDFVSPDDKNKSRIYNYNVGANYRLGDKSIVFFVPDDVSKTNYFKAGDKTLLSGDVKQVELELYDTDENGNIGVLVRKTGGGGGSPSDALFKDNVFVVDSVSETVDKNGEFGTKVTGFKGGKRATLICTDDDMINYTSNNFWDIRYGGIYTGFKFSDLRQGDIIGADLDLNGNVAGFLLLLSPQKLPQSYGEVMSDGGTPTPSNHLAVASTHYGVVKKRYTQSVLVNANGDGTDPAWNKTFLISGTNVYLYDREKKRVTMEMMGDVNEGDIVFIKTYYNAPKEVVIIR